MNRITIRLSLVLFNMCFEKIDLYIKFNLNNYISMEGIKNSLVEELDLDWFTCGILKHIPLDDSTMIFAGGLLFDAYYAHIHKTKQSYDLEKLKDIDLFLIGTQEQKILNVIKVYGNLKSAYGESNIIIGVDRAVISIYIKGFARIVQLVCTNYSKPNEVIDNFDMAHVAMYYSDKSFYTSLFAKISVQLKKVLTNPNCGNRAKPSRLVKYKSRGMDISEYIKEFPFNIVNYEAIYKKESNSLFYKQTKNLTMFEFEYENLKSLGTAITKNYVADKLSLELLEIPETVTKDNFEWTNEIEWSGDFEYLPTKRKFSFK